MVKRILRKNKRESRALVKKGAIHIANWRSMADETEVSFTKLFNTMV
jgi:hypothetical protein